MGCGGSSLSVLPPSATQVLPSLSQPQLVHEPPLPLPDDDMVSDVSAERVSVWRNEPVTMVWDIFRARPDPWQNEFLEAFAPQAKNRRMAARACKGPGKTAVLSWCIWNFLLTRPHPRIACTSITGDNLKSNLWPELAKWRNNSPLLKGMFEWTKTQIYSRSNPETWWCQARTWSRTADPDQQADTLAGLHADYVMAVLDEMGGIPPAVSSAAEGVLASGIEAKIIGGGNPTHRDGLLYFATVEHQDKWWTVRITGDPKDPGRSPRVDLEWANEQIDMWGELSPFVQVNVFGNFPTEATDTLLALAWVEDAFNRWHDPKDVPTDPVSMGVDVARYGTDNTIVTFRRGGFIDKQERWSKQDTEWTADEVVRLRHEYENEIQKTVEAIAVDDVGVGGGVTDKLLARGENVIPVDGGARPDDPDIYDNTKSELNFNVRNNWFKVQRVALSPSLRKSPLIQQGSTIKYGFTPGRDKVRVQSKDQYRTLHRGKSPDEWDSLVLAMAMDAYGESGGFAGCPGGPEEFHREEEVFATVAVNDLGETSILQREL